MKEKSGKQNHKDFSKGNFYSHIYDKCLASNYKFE